MNEPKEPTENSDSLRCSSSACEKCNGTGGRWDDESIDQWYPCSECNGAHAQYSREMWSVPKDVIYSAITALESALGYMPQIKSDVPQWQKTTDLDIRRMQQALKSLRDLR